MARIRTIKPEFFLNERLADLPIAARLLFVGLWTIADREGRLADRPRTIKASLLPWEDCDVDDLLWQLDLAGVILRYSVGEENFVLIPGFKEHQRPHPKEVASTIPEPGTPRSREKVRPSREKVRPSREKVSNHPVETRVVSRGEGVLGREGKESWEGNKDSVETASPLSTGPADEVFEYWRATLHPTARVFDAATRRKVEARLSEKPTPFTVDDLKRAIDGCKSNPHNMGANDRGKRYDSLELICRDGAKVQQFLSYLDKARPLASKTGYNAEDMYQGRAPPGRIVITDEMAPWRTAK